MGVAVQPLNGCARSCSTIERPRPKSVGIPEFQTLYNGTINLKDYLNIGASIRIGRESWCLPYAGFFKYGPVCLYNSWNNIDNVALEILF